MGSSARARSAAAHSLDLFCCVNRVEVISVSYPSVWCVNARYGARLRRSK